MSGRDYTNPNDDQPREEECFDFMWPRISNITVFFFDTTDDNEFNGGSIQEYTPTSEESIERREAPSADVQTLGISGNVRTRLSTGSHDMVDTTMVHVLRIFDRFRNMRLNSLGPDYMSHADNRHRTEDQEIQTRSIENAGYHIFYEPFILYSTIYTSEGVCILYKGSFIRSAKSPLITASPEETLHPNAIRTQDILGHTASSSRMAPVNHAYLCMDVTDCIIRPDVTSVTKSDSSDRERPSAMSSAVLWSLVSALTFMAGRPSNAFTICNSMYIDVKPDLSGNITMVASPCSNYLTNMLVEAVIMSDGGQSAVDMDLQNWELVVKFDFVAEVISSLELTY
ncbi:hypothetical protein Tco_0490700 [Tanacetum coccineum]